MCIGLVGLGLIASISEFHEFFHEYGLIVYKALKGPVCFSFLVSYLKVLDLY